MENAAFTEKMVHGSGNVLSNGYLARSGKADGTDDGLLVIEVAFERQEESSFLVVAEWPGEGAFVVLTRFGRFLNGESVGGVEDGVAIQKIYTAVQSWGTRFGGDFKPGAARICEKSGVGILVDPHFLDGGSCDAWPVGFDAVDDQRDAIGGDRVVVQEAGERGDVVLIKNGNAIEGRTFESVGALILRRVGGDLWGRIGPANSDGFRLRSESKCDAQRRQAFSLESDGDSGVFERRSGDGERVGSYGYFFEVKASRRVGFRLVRGTFGGRSKQDDGVGNDSAGGILNCSGKDR